MEDEAQIFHKEWRAIVLSKLNELAAEQKSIKSTVTEIQLHQVSKKEYEELVSRVKILEELKTKALAIWAFIQLITMAAAWVTALIIKKD